MLDLGCGVGGAESRVTSRQAWSALVLVAVLAIAGCSPDEDDPGTLPERTPTGTNSASPTPSETATPTESATPTADSTDALEAEITAFFEEYIDLVNESWNSREALDRRREMFADSCEECLAGYELAARKHRETLVFDAGDVVVRDVTVTSVDSEVVVFSAVLDSPAGLLKTPDGKVVQSFDEYVGAQVIYQAHQNSNENWIIVKGDAL